MAKVIIAIHGLGNKPPKKQLEKWGKMAIEEGIRQQKLKIKLPEFSLVYWADLLYDKPQTIEEKDDLYESSQKLQSRTFRNPAKNAGSV